MDKLDFLIKNKEECKKRIDKIICEKLSEIHPLSRNIIQKSIKNGHLSLNGKLLLNPAHKTTLKDKFTFQIPEQKKLELKPQNIPLNVVYEDKDMLVINKQANLITHPGAGISDKTLANALLYHYKNNLSDINGPLRPGIVHRLDKDTSGLMVVAKNNKAHKNLADQIKNKTLKRHYIAVIWGTMIPRTGKIEGLIDRSARNRLKMKIYDDKGKASLSHYQILKVYRNSLASLVECRLDTGRTHQIRVHLSHKKHPIIGDRLYGGKARKMPNSIDPKIKTFVEKFPRQALHSYKISFRQPSTGKLKSFETKYPEDIKKLTNYLESIKP